ncbi:AAA family ATPase [Paenibacillus filicis]|uniref:AAA family ATPase n=1 Tax=Paenibacillus filicis TaxID=669464 RepID=A0ABU9DW88_9BACL
MECVIFIGIQASGKSTFFKEKFYNSHIRINLDMLRTRNREDIFLTASIKAMQPFVVDNTNPTIADRKKYIDMSKDHNFKVIGYFFEPDYDLSYSRNDLRQGKEKLPEVAIKSTLKKLQNPSFAEGFDELYLVRSAAGGFLIDKID